MITVGVVTMILCSTVSSRSTELALVELSRPMIKPKHEGNRVFALIVLATVAVSPSIFAEEKAVKMIS